MSSGSSDEESAVATSFGVPEGVRRVFERPDGATRIVLIRHGEAVCNTQGVVGGVTGCHGLTDLGRRQVAALAARLAETGELADVDALYASVLPRAVETAGILQPVLGDGASAVVEQCDLCELHPGQADAMSWQEVIDNFGVPEWDSDPGRVIAPGGESWTGFVERASGAVRALVERHPGQLLVAAVHAGVIEATMIAFLSIPPAASRRGWARIVHASMTEWDWSPTRAQWVLIRFNDACGIPTA
ncbi:MAG TPA: histidine phosphatase family protein [Acidimicrobiales bacterium]|nr:histidine phosphatase family protein [Acidimicrobiales bacterium]